MTRNIIFIALSIVFLASCINREYKEGMTVTSFSPSTIFTADGSEISLKPEGMAGATTVLLVRHAEKDDDGTDNPGLTDAGTDRANRLAELFRPIGVKEVFMTDRRRVIFTALSLIHI